MSSTITPVSEYDTSSTLTVPSNGDDLDADVVKDVLQVLADRAEVANDSVLGTLLWSGAIALTAGGTSTSFTIALGDIRACVLECADGVVRCMSASTITLTQTSVEGGGADLTAAAQWWYIYAYSAAGTLAYEVSTTAPTSDLTWKTGSVGTKRYIGCFRTTAAGAPIAMRAHRGRYWYRITELGATDTRVLNAGGATSYTDVDLSSFVPPHARMAEIDAYLAPNTAATTAVGGATLRKNGTAGAGLIGFNCGTGTQWPAVERAVWIETDTSRVIEYQVSTSTGSDYPALTLYVYGFME